MGISNPKVVAIMRSDHVTNECYLLLSLIFWKLKDDFTSKQPAQNGCERERKNRRGKVFCVWSY